MNVSLLHLGSGALGLGLVIPLMNNTKNIIDIYILNRKANDNEDEKLMRNETLTRDKCYHIKQKKGHNSEDTFQYTQINFKKFINFEDKILEDLVKEDRPIFITTALKETGVKQSISIISELIYQRASVEIKHPLFFIACENAIKSSEVETLINTYLEAQYKGDVKYTENIYFLDSVVDRLCNSAIIENNQVICQAERYGSWVIKISSITKKVHRDLIQNILGQIPDIKLVDEIDFYVNRKKWLVNSTHQLVSLATWMNGHYNIDSFLQTRQGELLLNRITSELLEIYMHNQKGANKFAAQEFMNSVKFRLCNEYSNVYTALTRFRSKQTLEGFFKDFHRKVGNPSINYKTKTLNPLFWTSLILLQTIELINEERYID